MTEERKRERGSSTQNRTRRRRRREPAGPRAVGGPMGSKAQPHRVFLSTLDTFPPLGRLILL